MTVHSKTLSYRLDTIAGGTGGPGAQNGIGTAARFNYPQGITEVGGYLYVTDSGNSIIRRINVATKEVTTFAGIAGVRGLGDGNGATALFDGPTGIDSDGTNLYVSDANNYTIRKIVIATREVSTLVPHLDYPRDLVVVGSDLYVAQGGSAQAYVTKVDIATGTPTQIAGPFGFASAITTDGTNLYVADDAASIIRKVVIATSAVSIFAGSVWSQGDNDGIGTAAKFRYPHGLATDGTYIYVTDNANYSIRRIEISTATVDTIAGSSSGWGSVDGIGTAARFSWMAHPIILSGNLYFPDMATIKTLDLTTTAVTTVYGENDSYSFADGAASVARFGMNEDIVSDGTNLYIADAGFSVIRKLSLATGVTTTLAGDPGVTGYADGIGAAAQFDGLEDMEIIGSNLYVLEAGNMTVRKISIATGEVTTLAGTAGVTGYANGFGGAAQFASFAGLATDGTHLYVGDFGNSVIRKINVSTGEVTTIAGSVGVFGFADGVGSAAQFSNLNDLTCDGTAIYITDQGNQVIRKLDLSSLEVTTFVGSVGVYGSDDGIGTAVTSVNPSRIAVAGSYLYFSDGTNGNSIRVIETSTGKTTTLYSAGLEQQLDGAPGVGTLSRVNGLYFKNNVLYVAQSGSIRKISRQ